MPQRAATIKRIQANRQPLIFNQPSDGRGEAKAVRNA